jgi:23S rRNA (cytosine1962-C5)-methyltransferase
MNPCKITLKKTEEKRLLEGRSWVYSNEIDSIKGHIKSGELALVYDYLGHFIGKGFLNTSSKIFVRLLSRNDEDIDEVYFFFCSLVAKKSWNFFKISYRSL